MGAVLPTYLFAADARIPAQGRDGYLYMTADCSVAERKESPSAIEALLPLIYPPIGADARSMQIRMLVVQTWKLRANLLRRDGDQGIVAHQGSARQQCRPRSTMRPSRGAGDWARRVMSGYGGEAAGLGPRSACWRSLREVMLSLVNIFPRCHSTVRGLMNSWAPIWSFVCPSRASLAICAS